MSARRRPASTSSRTPANIDPERVAAAITPRTRAIILPVHYAGHPAELDAIEAIAAQREHRAAPGGRRARAARRRTEAGRSGPGPNPVAFSFYATKNLTTAEGGMLTADAEFLERARVVSLHGMSRDAWKRVRRGGPWYYDIVIPGFKYNMTDIQAALGRLQLSELERLPDRRRADRAQYHGAFGGDDALERRRSSART